jgi:hypothetical protein
MCSIVDSLRGRGSLRAVMGVCESDNKGVEKGNKGRLRYPPGSPA